MRGLIRLLFLLLIAAAGAWWWAGRATAPQIEIVQPQDHVGQATPLQVALAAPGGEFSSIEIAIEQNGERSVLFSWNPAVGEAGLNPSGDRVDIRGRVGKTEWDALRSGPARIVVRAARPVLYGLRQAASEAVRDVQVRLDPPRVSVLSTFHYINQGGGEFVVYRATPPDVESGVRVGDLTYPGFPAAGVGLGADPAMRVAFFALLYDQDPRVPIVVFARDAAGNEAGTPLDHRVFPKRFARSRIVITDRFLQQVVPALAATTPGLQLSTAPDDLLASFLRINGDLRRRNIETIRALGGKTAPEMLWREVFQPLGNAQVEAGFADSRTYLYDGREIDYQVHLGFDLAVTVHIPVAAANRGVVLYAGDLGIFGNCVILDHGLGVQSLYGHLSSMDVSVGDTVEKGQVMGRSGMTGLAAGDHLHFTMLINGREVNPIEWWDPKWMQDRVFRKIVEAGRVDN